MTAAERLQQLSGLSGVTAAAMLLAIGVGATAGAALVNYSGLPTGTAAEHLLTDIQVTPPEQPIYAGGGFYPYFVAPSRRPDKDEEYALLHAAGVI